LSLEILLRRTWVIAADIQVTWLLLKLLVFNRNIFFVLGLLELWSFRDRLSQILRRIGMGGIDR
jgi:hypothetical protein